MMNSNRKGNIHESRVNNSNGGKQFKGCEWLFTDQKCEEVFIPEDFSEDAKMMADSTMKFVDSVLKPLEKEWIKGY